jgi:phosphopantothenoylcysteine decarboxylase/phosphopantothenate--cysteine ligase
LAPKDFEGQRLLVTAGPTQESIDPVRFISNPSSGKMGYAVARAAEHRGGCVTLITGLTHLPDPNNVSVLKVRTAQEMALKVFEHMQECDVVVKTAAVSDFRPKDQTGHKLKKDTDETVLVLQKNQDILKELGRRKKDQILVGFAAETENLEQYAVQKLAEKNLDMIAANLIGDPASGFGSDTNAMTLFLKDGTQETLSVMPKEEVAHILLDRILQLMATQ